MRDLAVITGAGAALTAGALALLLTTASLADGPGDAVAGQRVAERWCAGCHAVEAGAAVSNDAARSFHAIANDATTTARALAAFLTKPHGGMPDFALSRRDIDDLVAYILSLKQA